jgi:hypothetical protein
MFERGRHFLGQHGLAGARLALDQQRALQRQGGVDRQFQVIGGDVLSEPSKALGGACMDGFPMVKVEKFEYKTVYAEALGGRNNVDGQPSSVRIAG